MEKYTDKIVILKSSSQDFTSKKHVLYINKFQADEEVIDLNKLIELKINILPVKKFNEIYNQNIEETDDKIIYSIAIRDNIKKENIYISFEDSHRFFQNLTNFMAVMNWNTHKDTIQQDYVTYIHEFRNKLQDQMQTTQLIDGELNIDGVKINLKDSTLTKKDTISWYDLCIFMPCVVNISPLEVINNEDCFYMSEKKHHGFEDVLKENNIIDLKNVMAISFLEQPKEGITPTSFVYSFNDAINLTHLTVQMSRFKSDIIKLLLNQEIQEKLEKGNMNSLPSYDGNDSNLEKKNEKIEKKTGVKRKK